MANSPYNEWLSLYDEEMGKIYNQEKCELRKISMIYTAFQKELNKINQYLSSEYDEIKTKIEQKNSSKLSKLEIITPLNEANTINEIPETELFSLKSPPITTNRLINSRKKKAATSPSIIMNYRKPESRLLYRKDEGNDKEKTTPICDTTNLIDCSIVDCTPIATKKSFRKNGRLKSRNKRPLQNSTLTQMFGSPSKKDKNNQVDSNFVSMDIEEMLDYINENGNSVANKENNFIEDTGDSDETIEIDDDDDTNKESVVETKIADKNNQNLLKYVDNYNKLPDRKVIEPNEVVRGKERKKLKGWSCKDCESFYKNLNLSPEELARKMDECSRHRRQFEREETLSGFWNLSFPPTQKTQEKDEESLVFRYRR